MLPVVGKVPKPKSDAFCSHISVTLILYPNLLENRLNTKLKLVEVTLKKIAFSENWI